MSSFLRFAYVTLGFVIGATISLIFGGTAGEAADDLVTMSFGALAMLIAEKI